MHSALRRLDLNLLLTFDALYRNRTVTNAARELSISASAFSHALGRLREALNDELFIRQGNRMHPTQRADLLASAVSESLRILSDQLASGSLSIRQPVSAPSCLPRPITQPSRCCPGWLTGFRRSRRTSACEWFTPTARSPSRTWRAGASISPWATARTEMRYPPASIARIG